MKHTSESITKLKSNEVIVFGSNLAGRHGKGLAKVCLKWGAEYGIGFGLRGQTFALPTKDKKIQTLPLSIIKTGISFFIKFAKDNPRLTFLVTQIGCGLAGYTPEQIAPLFKEALSVDNIILPKSFNDILIDNFHNEIFEKQ